jgi:serine/threonine protein kinase
MIAREFLRKHLPILPSMFAVAQVLGNGSNGEAYLLNDGTVLKVSVLMDWGNEGFDVREEYARIWWLLRQVKQEIPPHLVRIFDLGVLACGQLDKQPYTIYYYRMEHLQPLTEDEYKVFQTVISHEDRQLIKRYQPAELSAVLQGLEKGLEFDLDRVKDFYHHIQFSRFKHLDLHPRNVLKAKDGEFKLIDLDRMRLQGTS